MNHRSAVRRICLTAAVLLTAGLGGTSAARAGTAPDAAPAPGSDRAAACVQPVPASGTSVARVDLTSADNGREICVVRGQTLAVSLSVDPRTDPDESTWWTRIQATSTILTPMPVPRVPPAGTTLGSFRADGVGAAGLWSVRYPSCPGQICPPYLLGYWHVTVNVID